jgi:hypothetical protein
MTRVAQCKHAASHYVHTNLPFLALGRGGGKTDGSRRSSVALSPSPALNAIRCSIPGLEIYDLPLGLSI